MKFNFALIVKFVCLIAALITITKVDATEARLFSTEGYCILSFEQVDSEYLKKYEEKLGFRPKVKLCNRVNRLVVEFQPDNWNYKFGQPYPGSGIYLSPEQIEQIELARQNSRHARR